MAEKLEKDILYSTYKYQLRAGQVKGVVAIIVATSVIKCEITSNQNVHVLNFWMDLTRAMCWTPLWEWPRPFCRQPQVGSLKGPKPVVVR